MKNIIDAQRRASATQHRRDDRARHLSHRDTVATRAHEYRRELWRTSHKTIEVSRFTREATPPQWQYYQTPPSQAPAPTTHTSTTTTTRLVTLVVDKSHNITVVKARVRAWDTHATLILAEDSAVAVRTHAPRAHDIYRYNGHLMTGRRLAQLARELHTRIYQVDGVAPALA